jgi:Lamin Tail Domain
MMHWVNRFKLGGMAAAGMVMLSLTGCGSLDSSQKNNPRQELKSLRITEIHYNPLDQDSISGDDYEFIELYNAGDKALPLKQVGFTDGIEFTFGDDAEIEAKAYLVLASNAVRFEQRYGFKPFGAYTGKLSNSGETVVLTDLPASSEIASVSYTDTDPWPLRADGAGPSLALFEAGETPAWKASFSVHGSPLKVEPVPVLVNEVAAHTDEPEKDAVELYNPNDMDVDIGGWYLSDDRDELLKYRIPAGTVIKAGTYLVFDADDFNADSTDANAFSFSEHGDGVYITADSKGCGGFCHGFEFKAVQNGLTLGRHVNSWGSEHFVAQKSATLGARNAGPKSSPIVISEVMYHPANDTDEFVEIMNVAADSTAMYDTAHPDNTVRLTGFGFTFPKGVKLAPNEAAVILSSLVSETAFRTQHGLADSVRIFRTFNARLSNSSDTLTLLMPLEPYSESDGLVVPYQVLERVAYHDDPPWPEEPDETGISLVRKDLRAYADEPENWTAAAPTPGKR